MNILPAQRKDRDILDFGDESDPDGNSPTQSLVMHAVTQAFSSLLLACHLLQLPPRDCCLASFCPCQHPSSSGGCTCPLALSRVLISSISYPLGGNYFTSILPESLYIFIIMFFFHLSCVPNFIRCSLRQRSYIIPLLVLSWHYIIFQHIE